MVMMLRERLSGSILPVSFSETDPVPVEGFYGDMMGMDGVQP
jgi:hypothetical protein